MPENSMSPAPASPESGSMFAFNTSGNTLRTPAPLMTPETPAPAQSEAVKLTFNEGIGAPEVPVVEAAPMNTAEAPFEAPVIPLFPGAETVQAPEISHLSETPLAPEAPAEPLSAFEQAPEPELFASKPAEVPEVEPTVQVAESAAQPEPEPEIEIIPETMPVAEAEIAEPLIPEEENDEIDVDASLERVKLLEEEELAKKQEILEAKKEAVGQIKEEIKRIDQKALDLASDHKEALNAYRTQKETIQNARAAMEGLLEKTMKELGLSEADLAGDEGKVPAGPEAIAA